jgi:hypothetical protein
VSLETLILEGIGGIRGRWLEIDIWSNIGLVVVKWLSKARPPCAVAVPKGPKILI